MQWFIFNFKGATEALKHGQIKKNKIKSKHLPMLLTS